MQPAAVKLAGKEYQVNPLPRLQAKAFRQRISDTIGDITNAMRMAGSASSVELTDLNSLAGLLDTVGGLLAGSIDQVADLLFDFSPELAEDRERIEREGFDDEIIAAFLEVLRLLYPFGEIGKLFQIGR
jgi:hypothetical protein